MVSVGPFSVLELVGLLVSLIGLVPVLTQHRKSTKWFTAGYGLLVVGMIATNVENVLLSVVLNFVEHGVGIGLAGVVLFVAAYKRRQTLTGAEAS